jgi:lipopolysaccharide export system protein LptA
MHADTLLTIPDTSSVKLPVSKVVKKNSLAIKKDTSAVSKIETTGVNLAVPKVVKKDSLAIKKDTSAVTKNDAKLFKAYRNVRFYKTDLQGECDSLSYQMKDSTIYMFYDPLLWSQKNQMSADNIKYISRKLPPDIARLEKNAFIIMSEDSVRFNQISGKLIIGQIFNGKLRAADVNGNAQTIYYVKDNDKYTGMNKQLSSKIYFHLLDNKFDTIRFYPKPEGRIIPLKEIKPLETTLGGFVWRESERPLNPGDLYPVDIKRKKNADPKLKPALK